MVPKHSLRNKEFGYPVQLNARKRQTGNNKNNQTHPSINKAPSK